MLRSHPRPFGFIDPCLPTKSERPRNGPQWVHEVKHDGYRLMVCRNGDRVRLFTRHGYDWTERYPRIAKAMAELKITSALIDGEAVCWGPDGADFDKLHSRAGGRHKWHKWNPLGSRACSSLAAPAVLAGRWVRETG
jgi:ATP-dependent DNA ligase